MYNRINLVTRIVTSLAVLSSIPLTAEATTYIVFRYDDFAGDAPGIREIDSLRRQIWQAEQEVDRLFQRYAFSYTIAIIPHFMDVPLSADIEKVEFIKNGASAGRIEIAQHGLSHTNHVWEKDKTHRHGEFREREWYAQFYDIEEGKRIFTQLCGFRDIVIFIPPWNGWDSNTARALKKAGFKILSPNCFYWSIKADGLTIIPCTASLSELQSAVEDGDLPEHGVIVTLYHPKDICEGLENGSSYFGCQRFDELLGKISVLPDVKVVTLQQLASMKEDLTLDRFRSSVHLQYFWNFWEEVLPRRFFSTRLLPEYLLPGGKDRIFYLTEAQYREKIRFWSFLTAVSLLVTVFVGLVIRCALSRFASRRCCLIGDWLAVIVIILAVVSEIHLMYKGYHIIAARAIPGFVGAGFMLFWLLQVLKRGRCRARSRFTNTSILA